MTLRIMARRVMDLAIAHPFRLRAALVFGFVLSLAVLGFMPPLDISPPIGSLAGHVTAYAVGAALALLIFQHWGSRCLAIIGLWLIGLAVEAVQYLLAWRTGEVIDLVYNTLGLMVGVGAYFGIAALCHAVRRRRTTDRTVIRGEL